MISAPGWPAWLEVFQAVSTFAMTGVIWLVQLVQYPSFRRVGAAGFGEFHRHHCAAIGLVVGPLMVVEFLTALLLAAVGEPSWFWQGMLGLLLVLWLSTGLWQGRLHSRLSREGAQPNLVRALVP